MLLFATVNQELLIPRLSVLLSLSRDNPNGDREMAAHRGDEPNGIAIGGDIGTA